MKEELISYKTAVLAKEKGLPTFGISVYEYSTDGFIQSGYVYNGISASTQSLLQRWLREKHGIHIIVGTYRNQFEELQYQWVTEEIDPEKGEVGFDTYEQALEKGLYQALKLIKQ